MFSSFLIYAHLFLSCHRTLRVQLPPLHSAHQILIHIDKIPLRLLFSRLNSPRSLSLSSYKRCSRPLIIFVACIYDTSLLQLPLNIRNIKMKVKNGQVTLQLGWGQFSMGKDKVATKSLKIDLPSFPLFY